ncbi:ribonuclease E domain-containing protein [Subtercola endophyticus]|uniref:hypothetical protein n=1 Tax=Subtercola endophyticus TaxID=2895559 RepID=UPI001E41F99F|nr:hypothetical protein [Subtercola endophyticus]UFS60507.1 hypothetical protein LQ955_07145 [Subtercola endophyticus]
MTRSSREPGAEGDQATGPKSTFDLPVVTTPLGAESVGAESAGAAADAAAPLSRRELRQREAASEALPVVESRRQRRDRELAKALAASAAVEPVAPVTVAPAAAVATAAQPTAAAPPAAAAPRTVSKSLFAQQIADMAKAPQPVVETRVVETPVAEVETPLTVVSATSETFVPAVDVDEPVPAHLLADEPQHHLYDASDARNNAFVDDAPTEQIAVVTTPSEPQPVTAALQAEVDAAALNEAPVVTSVSALTFPRTPEIATPRAASTSVAAPGKRRVLPGRRRASSRAASTHPKARKRTIVNTIVMVATAGLVATVALPAYAYSDLGVLGNSHSSASAEMGIQSLTVGNTGTIQDAPRDGYTSTGDIASMDSTTGTTVSPTVQALAAELMADVASGKLVGSVPNHIVEIQNLANGVVVPNCGVDYRVLQAIKVAVDNFSKVGISDINRKCTGQIEGAGTASAHYTDGGGHAVDFYILNGHGLTGGDADSLKLIALLDPLVPPGSGLGQAECRGSVSVSNFAPFDDTCTHDHIDFLNAKGVALKSS